MRRLAAGLIIICIAFSCAPFASAAELPKSLEEYLNGNEAGTDLPETIAETVEEIKKEVSEAIKAPLSILSGLVAVGTAAAVAENLIPASAKGSSKLLIGVFSALGTMTVTIRNINGYLEKVGDVIETSAGLFISCVPVISGVLASSGKPGTAALLAGFSSAFASFAFSAASSLLPPLSSSMICLAAAGSIGSGFLGRAAVALKKAICWVMVAATTIAVGILKLQISASSVSDTLALKTGRYVVGESIPLVGKSISGAMSSLLATSAAMGSTAGIMMICAVAAKVLPLVVLGLALSAALKLVSFISEASGSGTAVLLEALRAAIDVNTAFLASFFCITVLSLGTVMNLGGGI